MFIYYCISVAVIVDDLESIKDEMNNIRLNTGLLSVPDYIKKLRVLLWKKFQTTFTFSTKLWNYIRNNY